MVTMLEIETTINGQKIISKISPETILVDFIRNQLGFTGTKKSCEMQICGSCTVLLDGEPVSSCCTLAYEINNREVLTIEGVADNGSFHPVQQAFLDEYGLQCGFCTPGMVLTTISLLNYNPNPSEETIKAHIGNSLCRCTGYYPILNAVKAATKLVKENGKS
jgi:aerobic carbon-monoxide dehydrogenase small subunit